MEHSHPSPETLLDLFANGGEEGKAWALHGLEHCPACQRGVEETFALASWRELAEVEPGSWTLDQAYERASARRALAAFDGRPLGERLAAVREEEACRHWAVGEALLAEARGRWIEEPREALALAEAAVALLERLEAAGSEDSEVTDFLALGWAYVANCRRIGGDLREADRALSLAKDRLGGQTGYGLIEARVLDLEASLRRAQRRFGEAEEAAERAIRVYLEAGKRSGAARVLLKAASVFEESGEPARGLAAVEKALFCIDRGQEPRLYFMARALRAKLLHETGRSSEAKIALAEVRRLAEEHGSPLQQVRWSYYEGIVAADENRLDEAEGLFLEVRARFLERDLAYDAALVNLDLAAVYARQGRSAEIRRLAAEMLPIFESQEVHREAMASLLLFRQAAEAELATLNLLRQVRTFLEEARGRPELSFQPPDGWDGG